MPEVDWDKVDADSIPAQKIYANSKVQEALSGHKDSEDLEKDVKVPYVYEGAVVMSPGVWNGVKYEADVIREGMENTDWTDDHNRALVWDHKDEGAEKWIGEATNFRMEGDDLLADLVFVDKDAAMKVAYGAHFGVSPKVTGRAQNKVMKSFSFDNFSLVLNPAIKTTWLNSEDGEERPRIHVTEVRMSMSDNQEVEGRREELSEYVSSDSFKEKFENADGEDRERIAALLSDLFDVEVEEVMEELPEVEHADDEEDADEPADDEADADAEAEAEAEDDAEEMADLDALADKVLDKIEAKNKEAESAEEETSEHSAEVAEFQQFVSEMKQENPELTYSEIVEKYEEANRDPVDALQERINELEDKLEGQVEEMAEKAQRVSAKSGKAESRQEELQEKVSNMSDRELDRAMTQMFKAQHQQGTVTMPFDGDEA